MNRTFLSFCSYDFVALLKRFFFFQSYCQVVITVTDTNEHAPQFTSSSYFGQILIGNPDALIGADETLERVVVRVRATDKDFGENARIFYSIDSGKSEIFCVL